MSSKNPRETGSDSVGQGLHGQLNTEGSGHSSGKPLTVCCLRGRCHQEMTPQPRSPTWPSAYTTHTPRAATAHDMDQWVLTTLSHLRPLQDPEALRSRLTVKLTALRSSPLHEHMRG